jgi:hypothetical protein
MSYATSRPKVNQFTGGVDIAATLRTHLQGNANNRKHDRMRAVAHAVANNRIHPVRLARIMRRGAVIALVLDLVN